MTKPSKPLHEEIDAIFRSYDRVFGKIEKLWIKHPELRKTTDVTPLYDTYRTFQQLRSYAQTLEASSEKD